MHGDHRATDPKSPRVLSGFKYLLNEVKEKCFYRYNGQNRTLIDGKLCVKFVMIFILIVWPKAIRPSNFYSSATNPGLTDRRKKQLNFI
ncbi:hypothetical protein ACTXT7_003905 [Hymenolepis weldensis]